MANALEISNLIRGQRFFLVQLPKHLLDKNKIVMNTPLFDKSSLIVGCKLLQLWG
jgi:hypothetical protein